MPTIDLNNISNLVSNTSSNTTVGALSNITKNNNIGATLNTSNFSTLPTINTLTTTQQINDVALQLANNQVRQQNKNNNSNNTNGNTFTMFITSDDVVENQKANVTSNITKIPTNSAVTSSIFTNSIYAWDLKVNNDVIATCVYAAKIVSSSYTTGNNLYNSTSSLYTTDTTSDIEMYINYMQYASLLLGSGENTFKISDSNGNVKDMLSFVAISYNRDLYKDKLDPGNIKIQFNNLLFTDNSGGSNEDPTVNQSYFSYDIIQVNPTTNTQVGNQTYGILYPSYGLILLDTSIFETKIGIYDDTTTSTKKHTTVKINNINLLQIEARAVESITSTYYFIRLKNGMYNYSNNPTFITGSLGDIKIPLFKESPTTYITTIGLYNNRQELLAVARLSKPIPKNFTNEIILQVKLDF